MFKKLYIYIYIYIYIQREREKDEGGGNNHLSLTFTVWVKVRVRNRSYKEPVQVESLSIFWNLSIHDRKFDWNQAKKYPNIFCYD